MACWVLLNNYIWKNNEFYYTQFENHWFSMGKKNWHSKVRNTGFNEERKACWIEVIWFKSLLSAHNAKWNCQDGSDLRTRKDLGGCRDSNWEHYCSTMFSFLVRIIATTHSSGDMFAKHYKSDDVKVIWEGILCSGDMLQVERSVVTVKHMIKRGWSTLT